MSKVKFCLAWACLRSVLLLCSPQSQTRGAFASPAPPRFTRTTFLFRWGASEEGWTRSPLMVISERPSRSQNLSLGSLERMR